MSLLPSRPDASPSEDAGPRVIGVDSDDADEVLSALSSGTARELLAELHENPAPPSELADQVDTSLQNAQYHLEKLESAGAVEVVDTAYSAKGREMDVYAPADQPLVIFAGDEDDGSILRTALSRLLGAVGLLGVASLAVQQLYGESLLGSSPTADPERGAAGGSTDGGAGSAGADGATATPDAATASGGTDPGIASTEPTPAGTPGGDSGALTTDSAGTPEPAGTGSPTPQATGSADGGDEIGRAATETATETAQNATDAATDIAATVTPTPAQATTAADTVRETTAGLPPGLIFFAGGLFAIALVAGVVYLR